MPNMSVGQRIKEARKERGLTQTELGDAIGIKQNTLSEMEAGKLKNWPLHAAKVARALGKPLSYFDPDLGEHIGNTPDLPVTEQSQSYVNVEVLPTFAGLGGGGTGDAEAQTALVSRRLVEDELHARPQDLLLIDLRGDSMFDPATGRGFIHGDQLLIDRRDTNPRQPGPFALWYDDGYVVKNVEIIRRTGKLRIFSNNPAYSDDEAAPEDVKIMGRPVWYARRL